MGTALRRGLLAALAGVALGALTGASFAGAPAAGDRPDVEARIRTLTLERAGARPQSLARDDVLRDIARGYSETMYRRDTLGHEVGGGGPAERLARRHRTLFGLVSENVAVQKRWPPDFDLAAELVAGWMRSPGHRKNILAPFERFEVGCFGDGQTLYCTQLFVRSATELATPVAFSQQPGAMLTVELAEAPDDDRERRIGLAPAGAEAPEGIPLRAGAARIAVPERSGLYQLELWTQQSGDRRGVRYRIVPGPYLCLTAGSDEELNAHQDETEGCQVPAEGS